MACASADVGLTGSQRAWTSPSHGEMNSRQHPGDASSLDSSDSAVCVGVRCRARPADLRPLGATSPRHGSQAACKNHWNPAMRPHLSARHARHLLRATQRRKHDHDRLRFHRHNRDGGPSRHHRVGGTPRAVARREGLGRARATDSRTRSTSTAPRFGVATRRPTALPSSPQGFAKRWATLTQSTT